MATGKKYYSARRVGEILGLPHLEVIRRIRRGDIKAVKMDWFWMIPPESVAEAKRSTWWKRRQLKLAQRHSSGAGGKIAAS